MNRIQLRPPPPSSEIKQSYAPPRGTMRVADVVLEMELRQTSFCDALRNGTKARGGQAVVGSPGGEVFEEVRAKYDLPMQAVSIVSLGQSELVEAVQKALLILPVLSLASRSRR